MKRDQENNIFYVVATPIGNLKDITYRAVEILSQVDGILCEDTRVTRKLLDTYNIEKPLQSYHAQSSQSKEDSLLVEIQNGKVFALVSDAGTPTISDPGVRLIARIRKELPEVSIIAIPGPSALIAALSISGFEGNQFTFHGFLPHKKGRKKIFDDIEQSNKINIFYESPHRLLKTLEELAIRFGEGRTLCVARELTKIYEESPVMNAQDMLLYFKSHPEKIKGECVILIHTSLQ